MTFKHYYDKWDWGEFRGGYTIAFDHERKTAGISLCSTKDQFCKKTGRVMAMERIDSIEEHGDYVIISAPLARSKTTEMLLQRALKQLVGYIMYKYPNVEFGITFGD